MIEAYVLAAELAARNIPKLRDIQNYYVGRGGQFLYLLSPSKAAHLPEFFVIAHCRVSSLVLGRWRGDRGKIGVNRLNTIISGIAQSHGQHHFGRGRPNQGVQL